MSSSEVTWDGRLLKTGCVSGVVYQLSSFSEISPLSSILPVHLHTVEMCLASNLLQSVQMPYSVAVAPLDIVQGALHGQERRTEHGGNQELVCKEG